MTAILLTLAGLVGTMLASMACLIFHCWELGAEANRIANNKLAASPLEIAEAVLVTLGTIQPVKEVKL